jgi:hypothetical protein
LVLLFRPEILHQIRVEFKLLDDARTIIFCEWKCAIDEVRLDFGLSQYREGLGALVIRHDFGLLKLCFVFWWLCVVFWCTVLCVDTTTAAGYNGYASHQKTLRAKRLPTPRPAVSAAAAVQSNSAAKRGNPVTAYMACREEVLGSGARQEGAAAALSGFRLDGVCVCAGACG